MLIVCKKWINNLDKAHAYFAIGQEVIDTYHLQGHHYDMTKKDGNKNHSYKTGLPMVGCKLDKTDHLLQLKLMANSK